MNSTSGKANFSGRLYVLCAVVSACLYAASVFAGPQSSEKRLRITLALSRRAQDL